MKIAEVKPKSGHVLIQPVVSDTTGSGIILAVSENSYWHRDIYGNVGKRVDNGQIVVYHRHLGDEIEFDDGIVLSVKDSDIIAEVEEVD